MKNDIKPGRYDEFAEDVLQKTNAHTAIVIVFDGNKGHGFSVCTTNPGVLDYVPELLKNVAEIIEIESSPIN